jgi:hypothetical protein
MANPRTTSDLWDDTEQVPHYLDDEVPHYPKLSARRVAIAHAVGVAGVIGTVALAAAAFAPRLSGGVQSLRSLIPNEEPIVVQPRAVMQVQPQPTAAPVETAPVETSAPAAPAPVEPPAALAAPVTSNPTTTAPSSESANSPNATNQAPASVAATTPSEPEAPPAAAPAAPSEALVAPAPKSAAAPQVRHSRPEPRLTWGEIQRRKDRYAEWLKEQHLEPVH